jgi:hypothetical protein
MKTGLVDQNLHSACDPDPADQNECGPVFTTLIKTRLESSEDPQHWLGR